MKRLLPVIVACTCLGGCSEVALARVDVERLADAIRVAEGNPNYGVLTKYKHTTPRQACINTIRHALKDYKGAEAGFIGFLGAKYCPVGANNDPRGLNQNWIPNVTRLYKQGTAGI